MVVLQNAKQHIQYPFFSAPFFRQKWSLCAECRLRFLCPYTEVSGERTIMFYTVKWLCITAKYP